MSKLRVAYIMMTMGLEYDDRIRKEMFAMKKIADVEFKIFAFHHDNHVEQGVLSYGVPFELVAVKGKGSKRTAISQLKKEYNFYSQIAPKVKDYDLLWIVCDQPFFFPLFSKKKMVWDLHEIPSLLIGSKLKNLVFHRMERRCPVFIHANQERLDYLTSIGVVRLPEKHLVLRNYPDNNWMAHAEDLPASYVAFKQWLGNSEYIYVQGLNTRGRYPVETLSAIMEVGIIKAVVLGRIPEGLMKEFTSKYPNYADTIYFVGQVIQAETAPFIAHCKFSIVYYSTDIPNNRYCEPNRMFQCLAFGKPVIVGCNEPLKNVVNQYGNGFVLESDGRSVEENKNAIIHMQSSYDLYKEKAYQNKSCFAWESQDGVFRLAFSTLGLL